MPGYTMLPFYLLTSTPFFASHSFFPPFPAHFPLLLPYSWTAFHVWISFNFMICPKHLPIFNDLGKTHRVFVKNLFMWCSSNHCFLWFLIHPNIFTSSAVLAYWNPLLLTMFWVFVSINSHQFERAVWAFHVKRIFVLFISHFIYECVRYYRVDIWTVCAIPCNGYPFSPSI